MPMSLVDLAKCYRLNKHYIKQLVKQPTLVVLLAV